MAEAVKRATVHGSFSPAEVGARVGLTKFEAEAAARALSNAGVLVLGFDCAAHFSPEFRKAHAPPAAVRARRAKQTKAAGRRSAAPR